MDILTIRLAIVFFASSGGWSRCVSGCQKVSEGSTFYIALPAVQDEGR